MMQPSVTLPQDDHGEGGGARHPDKDVWKGIRVVSPGWSDDAEKNQDVAIWQPAERIACVCDGTSSSPYAAEAARLTAERAAELLAASPPLECGAICDDLRNNLIQRRKATLDRDVRVPPGLPAGMRHFLEVSARERRQFGFQTTIIAGQFDSGDGGLRVRLLQCGDSQLIVFGSGGEGVWMSGVRPREDPGQSFYSDVQEMELGPHRPLVQLSTVTDVLPDAPDSRVTCAVYRFSGAESVLLASDGFLNAFPDTKLLYRWLGEHYTLLEGEHWGPILAPLHERLASRQGDDDIAFVWVGIPTVTRIAGAEERAP